MAQLREIDPVAALRANGDLVRLLAGRRWAVVLDARERGASWAAIGKATGVAARQAWESFRDLLH